MAFEARRELVREARVAMDSQRPDLVRFDVPGMPVRESPPRAGTITPAGLLLGIVLGVFSTGGGCGPGDDGPDTAVSCVEGGLAHLEAPPDPTKPFVWLGTTDANGFRAVVPGETLVAVFGNQGGSHVWGAARLYAPTEAPWVVHFALTGADLAGLGEATFKVDSCPGGVVELTYVKVFLYATPPFDGVLSVAVDPDESGSAEVSRAEASIHVE